MNKKVVAMPGCENELTTDFTIPKLLEGALESWKANGEKDNCAMIILFNDDDLCNLDVFGSALPYKDAVFVIEILKKHLLAEAMGEFGDLID